jgi:hypothetical protein
MPILKTKVNYQSLLAKLEAFFKDIGKDEKLLKDIGIFSLERVRAMVRSGYSLDGNNKSRLKKLSNSYKEMRMGIVRFRTVGKGAGRYVVATQEPDEKLKEVDTKFFDPTFSNLTFTGQLMKSLSYFITASKRQITVFVADTKRVGKYETLSNKDVAKHVSDNGRPFLGLDKTGVARIKAIVKKSIRDEILKQRLKKR